MNDTPKLVHHSTEEGKAGVFKTASFTDKSASDSTLTFPSIYRLLEKIAKVNSEGESKNKKSIKEDNLGNILSEQQQNYFVDSKVRDDKGRLKVMYHGTPESFTVFDRKKAKYSGLYGRGFYFTESNSHASQYG